MLLFQAQGNAQLTQKKEAPKEGSFAAVINELIRRAAGAGESPKKENEQPYFTMATNEQKPGSSPDLERAAAKLRDLRKRDADKADRILTDAVKEAEKRAGFAPKGDLLASIEREKKMQDFMIKKLDEEIGRA